MNAAFIVPFATALMDAMCDEDVARNANLLALVYDESEDDAPRITPERPELDPDRGPVAFVVVDIPFGGRAAYVHGEDGDAVAHWSRFQVSAWAPGKLSSMQVMDAVIQAIDGRDIVVSDDWGTVRCFAVSDPWAMVDEIAETRMYGAGIRYEVLLVG